MGRQRGECRSCECKTELVAILYLINEAGYSWLTANHRDGQNFRPVICVDAAGAVANSRVCYRVKPAGGVSPYRSERHFDDPFANMPPHVLRSRSRFIVNSILSDCRWRQLSISLWYRSFFEVFLGQLAGGRSCGIPGPTSFVPCPIKAYAAAAGKRVGSQGHHSHGPRSAAPWSAQSSWLCHRRLDRHPHQQGRAAGLHHLSTSTPRPRISSPTQRDRR
jgi:hypothetical protein